MKKLYWRPQHVSLGVLGLLSFVTLCSFIAVETFRMRERQPHYRDKMKAAQTALVAFRTIGAAREGRAIVIDPETDPAHSGLIGELITPITTNTGHAGAKQTSVNPNFAAVVLELLTQARVGNGDLVAVGMSGSFPALNIAVLAALHTLEARPLIISSAGSSQWGANHPDFTWPDMEKILFDSQVFPFRSLTVSLGGVDDRALGLSGKGKRMLREAIERSGLTLLEPSSYADSLDRRMAIYREHAGEGEIRAYVNVGGGTTSVGTRLGKLLFKPGLNKTPPRGEGVDSVMLRFAERGVPVIHLTKIDQLAQQYGLPLQPTTVPPAGEGKVFVRVGHNRWLAGGALVLIFAIAAGLLRFDLGHRLLEGKTRAAPTARPEPMV